MNVAGVRNASERTEKTQGSNNNTRNHREGILAQRVGNAIYDGSSPLGKAARRSPIPFIGELAIVHERWSARLDCYFSQIETRRRVTRDE
jgi:hypothetical protein